MTRFWMLGLLPLLLPDAALGQPSKGAPLDSNYLRSHAQTRGFLLGRPMRPQPTPDGRAVLFLRAQPRAAKLSLFEFDVGTGQTRELLTPEQVLKGAAEQLSPEEKARRERMRVSVGGFTSYQLSDDGSLILLSLSGKLYAVERATGQVRELQAGPGTLLDSKFSPDGKLVSYVRDNDVYVLDLATRKETQVTRGGTPLQPHGLAEFVAQEEMGRFTGYWWSPDSKHIAYQETDHRGVEIWNVFDPIRPDVPPTPFFYPRPGKANAQVKLGVAPIQGGDTTWVDWDRAKYPYLATVRWPKDGRLSLVVQTRDQQELALLAADETTGKTKELLTEQSKTWVNLHQEVPRWLPGGNGFFWISERTGGPQLELRNRDGRLRRVLVPPEQGFQGLVSVDARGEELVYRASLDPTQSHLFRLNLKDPWSEPTPLTKQPGLYVGSFAKDHSTYVVTGRTLTTMPQAKVFRADGKFVGELPSVAEEPPVQPRVELLKVGNDAVQFHAAIVFPRDFDPKKKYPVIVDVYGGPHHLHVSASKQRWLLDQWYADQGFLVVAVEGRGTPGRGSAWERAIYQNFHVLPLKDQVKGLLALAEKYPAMDLQRVGIDGWSFGGYLAALAVLRRPDVFRAAVAGAPVTDWLDYDTHYTERYLGIPPKDADVYDEASLLTYAPKLERPLLILHGTADDNVYFRHSLKLVDALFKHNKDFEVVPLSGLTHMVPDPQVMEALHGRIARFFQRHLGAPR